MPEFPYITILAVRAQTMPAIFLQTFPGHTSCRFLKNRKRRQSYLRHFEERTTTLFKAILINEEFKTFVERKSSSCKAFCRIEAGTVSSVLVSGLPSDGSKV